ncbi:MAG TPA: hypothetical protein VGL51_06325 [Solirubrobacteraceae bacterium]|jgi:hypothetical protein
MSSKFMNRWSALLATGGVGLALVIAGCGGSGNAPHHTATTSGTPAATSTTVAAKPAANSPIAGIPQHNGGDQDADNNGGPSDGDGNI